ncbi:MFS general substrate transporter [Mycena indigotica]|uniref:MFS general substrate transporter n=1 Tax=Mycena indigotica TaxID=2126181 RepID=A0A8H6W4X5_9AGAR|nr:MFS general substrate transporter [Mycena indigotica]KAF7301923.1 MFS general substrate transporter [Mycena indigotica]
MAPSTIEKPLDVEESQPRPMPMQDSAPLVFPEGGRDAWLTIAGGWMVSFCTFGAIQSFGVYQDYYTRIFLNEHPPSDISWIGSVQIFFLFSIGIFSGKLFDHGYFRQLLVSGSTLYIVSSFLLSLAKPHHFYQNFLAQSCGMGIGMGTIFLPSLSVAAHYFKRRRGIAVGIMLSGSSVGAVIYPVMINHLFSSVGFAWGVRAVSFLDTGLLLCANLIMKTRLAPRPSEVDMKAILKDVPFWTCLVGEAFTFWGLFIPIFYIQLFSVKHNASKTLQTYCVAILNAAGFFGRTVPMFFSDLWGPFYVIVPVVFISGCLSFAFLGAKSDGGLVIFAILYGFFSGGFVSLSVPMSATFSRSVAEIGTRIGLMSLTCSFTLLTGNPISGVLLHPPRYTWIDPIVFSGVTIFTGLALISLAGLLQRLPKGSIPQRGNLST